MQGSVKFFNASKGFGFITSESGEDVFVHISALDGLNISEGDNVTFDIVDGNRGKAASNVKLA
ncbi:MAG: cold-shock protein [Flavobacteriaceae bacterium]|jgi:CspA family cold shock protein